MGSIVFRCACGQKLSAKTELAGKVSRCPKCKKPVRIPEILEEQSSAETVSSLWRPAFLIPITLAVFLAMGAILTFSLLYSRASSPRRLAGKRIAAAQGLVLAGNCEQALAELEDAEQLLRDANISSGHLTERIASLRSKPPLKHVLAGKVQYHGQWMTPQEKAMLERGYVQYEGRWVTPKENEKLDAGYVKHAGAWVTPEEKAMLEAGYVKHEARWVTPDQKARLQAGYVQYRREWVTPEEKANLQRGLVRFDGGWTTARGKATLQCIWQIEDYYETFATVEVESVEQVLDLFSTELKFYRGLEIAAVDPDLRQVVREQCEMLTQVEQFFRELVSDRDQAQETIDIAALRGGLGRGLEAAAYAETTEQGLARGALLGFLGALEASEEAQSREMRELVQKWEPKFTHEFAPLVEKLEALGAREELLFDDLRRRYDVHRLRVVGLDGTRRVQEQTASAGPGLGPYDKIMETLSHGFEMKEIAGPQGEPMYTGRDKMNWSGNEMTLELYGPKENIRLALLKWRILRNVEANDFERLLVVGVQLAFISGTVGESHTGEVLEWMFERRQAGRYTKAVGDFDLELVLTEDPNDSEAVLVILDVSRPAPSPWRR